ncbi:hypothetical protein [Candidatus Electronema sp. JC]|uniref:hypothetical protein n=1 Tax=Candidatus Electronema sp. JC TaxID=3401570 RepID=UPI003AA9550F
MTDDEPRLLAVLLTVVISAAEFIHFKLMTLDSAARICDTLFFLSRAAISRRLDFFFRNVDAVPGTIANTD